MVEYTSHFQEDSCGLWCCKYLELLPLSLPSGLADKRQPVILATFFIALKIWTRRGYVKLDNDVVVLQRAIEYLKQPKRERESRGGQRDSDVEVTTWGANISDGNGQSPRSIQEGQEA